MSSLSQALCLQRPDASYRYVWENCMEIGRISENAKEDIQWDTRTQLTRALGFRSIHYVYIVCRVLVGARISFIVRRTPYGPYEFYCGSQNHGINLECCRNQDFEQDVSWAAKKIYPPRLFCQPVSGLTQIYHRTLLVEASLGF